jgi:hypothetical protein
VRLHKNKVIVMLLLILLVILGYLFFLSDFSDENEYNQPIDVGFDYELTPHTDVFLQKNKDSIPREPEIKKSPKRRLTSLNIGEISSKHHIRKELDATLKVRAYAQDPVAIEKLGQKLPLAKTIVQNIFYFTVIDSLNSSHLEQKFKFGLNFLLGDWYLDSIVIEDIRLTTSKYDFNKTPL